MIDIQPKVRSAMQAGLNPDQYNTVKPALTWDSVQNINIVKSVFQEPLSQSQSTQVKPSSSTTRASVPVSYPPASPMPVQTAQAVASPPKPTVHDLPVPRLEYRVNKGQKTALQLPNGAGSRLKVSFGWNIKDPRCDVDASAFLVTQNGKVISDDWFVFYSQPCSPDQSVRFQEDGRVDREILLVDLGKLNPQIQKIVFVVTINEALENRLNFSMLRDTYIRILDSISGREIVSYMLDEYYANVTSMTIGELYLHNGQWKFNPVGNGVHTDLAGQCAVYGVEIC